MIKSRSFLSRLGYPLLGCLVGGLMGCAALFGFRKFYNPHEWLIAHAPDRVYVSLNCTFSQRALADLALYPGVKKMVSIPLEQKPGLDSSDPCGPALQLIRTQGDVGWSILPDSYVCSRLVSEAHAWLSEQSTGEILVPGWVVEGVLGEPGYTVETAAWLQAQGFLSVMPTSLDSSNL